MYKLFPILLFAYGFAITTDDIYDNSWALIIGIDKYQNVQSLDYAVNDAKDIQNMLVGKFQFPKDNIRLLINEEATHASILQEFSNITKKAGTNDRVLIFFAGHGKTEDLPDGGEIGYLLPVDANDDLYLSSINMDEIKTLSLRSEAKHILYLIDACYGGIISVGARNAGNFMMWGEYDYETTQDYFEKTTKTNFFQKITQDKSRQIITAGGRDEIAQEKAEWGHSAFTKNLLSGLRDSKADINTDGYITSQELGSYLKKKVTIDTNKKQTPKIRDLSSDEGEFVFVLSEDKAIIKNKSIDTISLDDIMSEIKELKTQSITDKNTKPDLNVNPDIQQSDNSLLFSFIYVENNLVLFLTKFLDKRSAIGLGYHYDSWEGKDPNEDSEHYGDRYKTKNNVISTAFVYSLGNKRTKFFNPTAALIIDLMFVYLENEDREISDNTSRLRVNLGLLNRVQIYKNIGVTFGFVTNRNIRWGFTGVNHEIIEIETDFVLNPALTIDISIPTFSKKKD